MKALSRSILQTLVYADVFDYPLTADELYRFLIADRPLNRTTFNKAVTQISPDLGQINTNNGYYFLRGREKIVALRKKRERWSQEKLRIAQRVAGWLHLIPWIKMAAVTGALAMKNSDREDDIDLLIVSARNRLWSTRFLTVLLVELVAQRRRPGDQQVKDKICLNMFLDEAHLRIPQKEQNLFTAHEACQLKPIWEKDGTYQKFLHVNRWVEKYLMNGIKTKEQRNQGTKKRKRFLVGFFEKFAFRFQLFYMKSRRTTEVVELGRVRFHPEDCQRRILAEYKRKLKKLRV